MKDREQYVATLIEFLNFRISLLVLNNSFISKMYSRPRQPCYDVFLYVWYPSPTCLNRGLLSKLWRWGLLRQFLSTSIVGLKWKPAISKTPRLNMAAHFSLRGKVFWCVFFFLPFTVHVFPSTSSVEAVHFCLDPRRCRWQGLLCPIPQVDGFSFLLAVGPVKEEGLCACSSATADYLWHTHYVFCSHSKSFLWTLNGGPWTHHTVWIFLVSGIPSYFKLYSSL